MSSTEMPEVAELVVLVDDDPRTLREMRGVVTDIGLRALDFGDASPALATVLARRPDVVVVDHALAARGGIAFVDRIRSGLGDVGPGLIALARWPARLGAEERLGFDVILAKPVGVSELVDAIDVALARREARQARALR